MQALQRGRDLTSYPGSRLVFLRSEVLICPFLNLVDESETLLDAPGIMKSHFEASMNNSTEIQRLYSS